MESGGTQGKMKGITCLLVPTDSCGTTTVREQKSIFSFSYEKPKCNSYCSSHINSELATSLNRYRNIDEEEIFCDANKLLILMSITQF